MNREGKSLEAMGCTICDHGELVEYYIVASAPDDHVAHANLVQLVELSEAIAPRTLWYDAALVLCDRCGCSVDTDLICSDGHHYSDEGDFYCAECWVWANCSRHRSSQAKTCCATLAVPARTATASARTGAKSLTGGSV